MDKLHIKHNADKQKCRRIAQEIKTDGAINKQPVQDTVLHPPYIKPNLLDTICIK